MCYFTSLFVEIKHQKSKVKANAKNSSLIVIYSRRPNPSFIHMGKTLLLTRENHREFIVVE